ncbi:MAG: VTT domain-containing protein, partial [Bdellovibrionota bacterium]
MEIFSQFLAILQDLPAYLATWTTAYGPMIYVILFAIVFAETGLVVTPFLPGDSLLFAVGSLTAFDGGLDLLTSIVVLWAAAVIGDNVNYSVGRSAGKRLFTRADSKLFNPNHLARTEAFFAKHGGRTLVMARFLPIFRTYAPFVAGMSRMEYRRFLIFSVFGGATWISAFTLAGHFFGN